MTSRGVKNGKVERKMTTQRRTAIRAWDLIRTKILEVAAEKRKRHTSFNWTFLSQHIAYMSDQEKARQELYQKYIYHPNAWADGLVNYPHHLFSQNRQQAIRYDLARSNSLGLHAPSSSSSPKHGSRKRKSAPKTKHHR